jgi:hypothetical protein
MSRTLTLAPNSFAVRDLLAAGAGGTAIAGDFAATFSAFSADLVKQRWPLRLPSATERLGLALSAARAAGLNVAPRSVPGFAAALGDLHASGVTPEQLGRLGPAARGLAGALQRHAGLLEARALRCRSSASTSLHACPSPRRSSSSVRCSRSGPNCASAWPSTPRARRSSCR